MKDSVERILISILLRTLEMEPHSKLSDNIERLLRVFPDIPLLTKDEKAISQHLNAIAYKFRQRAVINPYWLSTTQDMHFYFYLVNSQPGWLRQLVEQTKALGAGVSHYILYGEWDSLVVLFGIEREADELLEKIQATTNYELAHFSARNIPFFYRYKPTALEKLGELPYSDDVIKTLVEQYGTAEVESELSDLERAGLILGPSWSIDSSVSPRISAFIGISFKRGSHEITPDEVLEALLRSDSLNSCMVHLFEVDKGYPFHYLAKLVCKDMEELDKATDAIGFTRIGRVGFEGNTLIVASEKEDHLTLRSPMEISIAPSIDLGHVEEVANQMITKLGLDTAGSFNKLDGTRQLIILRSLDELYEQAQRRSWDEDREKSIQSAITSFAGSVLEDPEIAHLEGAVMIIATAVEGYVRHALRRIAESAYARDYARAQDEFKLSTKDFRKISLGKAVHALQTIKKHDDFDFLSSALEDDWLERLEKFTDIRNAWAHDGVSKTLSGELIIDEARRAMVEAIELIRWIGGNVIPALAKAPAPELEPEELTLPERPSESEPAIFISHSALDGQVAERIANVLKSLPTYNIWYAEWAIAPGESIVEKIEENLSKTDLLLILLSPNSVTSRWVQRELNATLMRQLSGQKVSVVPILIKECEIPATLKDIKRIDMAGDFQAGVIELLEFLRKWHKSPETI